MTTHALIDSSHHAAWHKDGYVQVQSCLSIETCTALCRVLEDNPHHECFTQTEFGQIGQNAWRAFPLFKETLDKSAIVPIAKSILGVSELCLFQDLIIWKPPHSRREVAWHQDYSYWPLSAPKGLTFWIALDASPIESGCIRYLPQSHTLGECTPTLYTLDSVYTEDLGLPQLPVSDWTHPPEDIPCGQGDAIVHHPLSCHMSPVNTSPAHRRAWSITLVPAEVRWSPSHAPHPLNHQLNLEEGQALPPEHFPRYT